MRKPTLETLFYAFAMVFWSLYTCALASALYTLFTWELSSAASRLWIGIADVSVLFMLTLFVWWAEYGNANRPRICGLPDLNSWHWVYIGAVVVWIIYFTPLAGSLYLLLTWNHETGTFRFGMAVVNLALMHLMASRIGRQQ